MLSASVKLQDRIGSYQKIRDAFAHADGTHVKVGFPSESLPAAGEAGDISEVAEIAAFNEFGTSSIPERPFFRQGLDNNKQAINEFVDKEHEQVLTGNRSVSEALNRIGLFVQSKIQDSIRNGDFAPLHPATKAAKGSTRPLIDTAQMLNSVTYVVKE